MRGPTMSYLARGRADSGEGSGRRGSGRSADGVSRRANAAMMGVMGAAPAARRMWTLFEPVHVVTYFAPEARAAFEEAGLRGFWRGYFAGRSAPLGPVDAPPVIAAFFGFAP